MGSVLVLYHSQEHGNTAAMAKAVAEGAEAAGAHVALINANEQRMDIDLYRTFDAVFYYLFLNGIGGNVLSAAQLAELLLDDTPKVVYADTATVGPAEMAERKVAFKRIPYDLKGY